MTEATTTTPRYRTRDDMLGGLRRQIRALPAYAAESAEVDLADFSDLVKEVQAAQSAMVVILVTEQGWSWGRVADELSISRQAARQRWGGHVARALALQTDAGE
jgi:hypothetical protein